MIHEHFLHRCVLIGLKVFTLISLHILQVHMIYGEKNVGVANTTAGPHAFGFYPHNMGETQILDKNVSVGVFPDKWDSVERVISAGSMDASPMERDSSSSVRRLQVLSLFPLEFKRRRSLSFVTFDF